MAAAASMAQPTLSFKRFVKQRFPMCVYLFIYAVLEWMMIMMILLDGFLAFLSDEFARLFELNIPCLLCTRIEYVMSHRKQNLCYNDCLCEEHKRDISSLAYCHIHKKISEIRHLCDNCLISFATSKDSDCERYKPLLGLLHKDVSCFADDGARVSVKSIKTVTDNEEAPQVDKDTTSERCSCCGDFIQRLKYNRNLSMNSNAPAPSPRAWRNEQIRSVESPRIRFTDIKLRPDNDSELPYEEDSSTPVQEEACRTPSFLRASRFLPSSDSVQASPRLSRLSMDVLSDSNDTSEGYHKSLMALKMELDEERNASAIAANNAMAMITRLQEEKAALQMEAFQYQRMMEEEVEFDQEEVELMRDMLIKREEEMKIMESELEAYRQHYGPLSRVNGEAYEVPGDEDYLELRSHFLSSFGMSECTSPTDEVDHLKHSGTYTAGNREESSVDYEFENSHLSGSLTNVGNKTTGSSDEEEFPSSELNKDRQGN
ncbi:PREDICTED: probable myosin-binding protein 5 isoform X2 [Ipomoea nil]|uniref:probable myosin-binding protein 5 isoform X2 n=1 Tax=Ipomoea nil TaxID=35883 RepID=UPI000900DCC8|nr:PREDICTED: probable myosin-binding protein 5 isoform X2 [Ipomoea nil]